MKAYEIQGSFGLENLKKVDRPDLEPGPGQVVVNVSATSLNYRDLLMVRGLYNPKQPLPLVPNSDGVGTISAVGQGVTRVKVGDRVCGSFFQGWIAGQPSFAKCALTSLGGPLDGFLAEQVLLSAEGVVAVPDYLSDEEAATLPCAGLTAWSALVRLGDVKPGDTVLVLGTGGVSMYALQIARLMGAEVIVTSSSDEKLERAKELGATHTINYATDPKWSKTVKTLTGNVGVDNVIEVGGAGTLEQSLRSVRIGGTVSMIGILSGVVEPLNVIGILMQEVRVQGVFVGHREAFEDMNAAFDSAKVRPIVDKVFGFDEAAAAFEHMATGKHFGKIVVKTI